MIRIRSLPLALVFAIGASATAHADDLLQVYQEARASDPTLSGAEATKLATDENVDQARAQLLPQIAASLDFTRARGCDNGNTFVNVPPPNVTSPFTVRAELVAAVSSGPCVRVSDVAVRASAIV